MQAQNIQIYWDAYLVMDGPPLEHKYVSVIINSGTPSDQYGIGAVLTEQSKELYYKYGRWYDELRVSFQTHQQFRHLVIFVFDHRIELASADEIKSEVHFWLGQVVWFRLFVAHPRATIHYL